MTATWKEQIQQEMERHGDSGPLIACTLTEAELGVAFDDSYGLPHGAPFTAWTAARVYFPIVYDGAEWAGSAPRHPSNEALEHQGGG